MLPELLKGVILPASVAAVVLILGAVPWRSPEAHARPAFTPLALLLGFAAGFAALYGLPSLPVREFWQWLFYLAVPIAGLTMLGEWSRLPCLVLGIALVLVAGVFAWGVVPNFAELNDSRSMWRLLAAACFIAVRLSVRWGYGNSDTRFVGLLLVVIASGVSGFLILAHTARLAQVCGIIASVAGAGLVLSLWRSSAYAATRAAGVVTALLLAVVLLAMFYDDSGVARGAFLCAGLAPIGGALARALSRGRIRGVWGGVLHVVLVLAPIGVALYLASRGETASGGEEYDYSQYYQ